MTVKQYELIVEQSDQKPDARHLSSMLQSLADRATSTDAGADLVSGTTKAGTLGVPVKFRTVHTDDDVSQLVTCPEPVADLVTEHLRSMYGGAVQLTERDLSWPVTLSDVDADQKFATGLKVDEERPWDALLEGTTLADRVDRDDRGLPLDEVEAVLTDSDADTVVVSLTIVPIGAIPGRINTVCDDIERAMQTSPLGKAVRTLIRIISDIDQSPSDRNRVAGKNDDGDPRRTLKPGARERLERFDELRGESFCHATLQVAAVADPDEADSVTSDLNDVTRLFTPLPDAGTGTSDTVGHGEPAESPLTRLRDARPAEPTWTQAIQPDPEITIDPVTKWLLHNNPRSTLSLTGGELGAYIARTAAGKGDSGVSHPNTPDGHYRRD